VCPLNRGNSTESKKAYILLPGIEGIDETDLQFMEYAKYVDNALASKGFIKAKDKDSADVAIFLIYGIGNPPPKYSMSATGQSGVSSSKTRGKSGVGIFGNEHSETTTYTMTYFKYLILDAVEPYKQAQKTNQIWQTTATNTGTSSDLRGMFPILVVAAEKYLGLNTGKKVYTTVTEKNERLIEIKSIIIDAQKQKSK